MVLGDGARDRGAVCDRINEARPGVGYVVLDGVREPMRVRAAYVDDDELVRMAAEYRAWPGDAPADQASPDRASGVEAGTEPGPDDVDLRKGVSGSAGGRRG